MTESERMTFSSPGPQHRHHREDDHEVRERHPRVDDALHDEIVGAAEVAAGDADGRGHQGGQEDRREPDGDRHAGAVDDPAPEVAAEVVGAEPVRQARRLHARAADRLVVAIRRDALGEDRHDEHRDDEHRTDRAQRLAPDEAPHHADHAPGPRPRRTTHPRSAPGRRRMGRATPGTPVRHPSTGCADRARRRARRPPG